MPISRVRSLRWDHLKDPLGVLAGFVEYVHAEEAPHHVLAGPDVDAVADDPKGAGVLAEVQAAWEALPTATRRRVHLAMLPIEDADENAIIVDALQRRSESSCRRASPRGSDTNGNRAPAKTGPSPLLANGVTASFCITGSVTMIPTASSAMTPIFMNVER